MLDGVKRCSECVRCGCSCNGSGELVGIGECPAAGVLALTYPASLVNCFLLEKRRIEWEEKAVEEALVSAY